MIIVLSGEVEASITCGHKEGDAELATKDTRPQIM